MSEVESRCGAVAVGASQLLPPLSSGGAAIDGPWLRFHIPLVEPDWQISRIRLSDKASSFRPREVTRTRAEPDEPQLIVEVPVVIALPPGIPHFVLQA